MAAAAVKKAKNIEDDLNDDESEALEMIDACQNEIDSLNEKASEEILKIEKKYNALRKPLFEQRNTIIKRIPNFWVTALINHSQISAILDERDENCLNFLEKIYVEEFDDIKSGYAINFFFAENPYFENKVLTKEFHLNENDGPTSVNTQIKWKEGRNKQSRNVAQKNKRKRSLEYHTFFDWFQDNSDPINDQIGELIKDDLWHNPLQYFLVPDIKVDPEEDENTEGDDEDAEEEAFEDEDEEAAAVAETK